jgi:hypothetical protein
MQSSDQNEPPMERMNSNSHAPWISVTSMRAVVRKAGNPVRECRAARTANAPASPLRCLKPENQAMARQMMQNEGLDTHSEGTVAKVIEKQTAKLPSDTFLWLAVGSMIASASLQLKGQQNVSLFIGQWAPSFLLFGIYNKLVKQLGSDRTETAL